jgi:hypothetical protein
MQHDHSIGAIFSTTAEKIQAVIAAGAIASPLWERWLRTVSEDAALLAPILGCAWLAVQIGAKLYELRRRSRV